MENIYTHIIPSVLDKSLKSVFKLPGSAYEIISITPILRRDATPNGYMFLKTVTGYISFLVEDDLLISKHPVFYVDNNKDLTGDEYRSFKTMLVFAGLETKTKSIKLYSRIKPNSNISIVWEFVPNTYVPIPIEVTNLNLSVNINYLHK